MFTVSTPFMFIHNKIETTVTITTLKQFPENLSIVVDSKLLFTY